MLLLPFAALVSLASLCHGFPQKISDRQASNSTDTGLSIGALLSELGIVAEMADSSDLSWIKNWASVGDSYSAGIGSGSRLWGLGNWLCSRYDASFPALINADERLGEPSGRSFNYWPCSGAITSDAINQVNALASGSQDLITITTGGNDAYLSAILNECVFQWFSDADPWNSQCPTQLAKSQAVIDSDYFHSQLDTLLSAAISKLNSNGHVYYVGYAQFFGQNSSQCDSVTWAYWYEYGKREYLLQGKRAQMNTLVVNMNNAIRDAVARAGALVTFIDYDAYYAQFLGRYCEDNYPETNANRNGLLFYEWDTDDSTPETSGETVMPANLPFPPVTPDWIMNGTFEADINNYILQALSENPSWASNYTYAQAPPPDINTLQATPDQIAQGVGSSVIPDGYRKIFHPRPNGHQLIANLVLYHVEADYAARLGQVWPAESLTSGECPAPWAVASITSSTMTSAPTETPPPPPPLPPPPAPSVLPTDTCGDWYKFFFDHFEIYGANFNENLVNTGGAELEDQIKGCGALTEWSFTTLTDDPNGYMWFASGNLPIGTKNCVGHAVVSAGGASADGCSGAG